MASPSITGLGNSGVDFSGIITQLVAIARQPITALSTKKNAVDSAASTIDAFATQLTSLQSAAKGLSDPSGFVALGASSTDPAIVATTSAGGAPGTYNIDVGTLAAVEKRRSDVQSSSGTALGFTGTLGIGVGSSTPASISVAATDTLGDIANKINASGTRASASVLYDGSKYRLVLQGLDSGAASGLAVTETGFSLGLSKSTNVYQAATDASLTVDGMAITRPTNSISGVIPGVTLALTKPTTSTATLTLATDPKALEQKVQSFVTAYNTIVSTTHNVTGYGTTTAANPQLAGDSAMRRSLDRLAGIATSTVANTRGAYTTLASVGISLSRDGTMSLDTSKFESATASDPDGVARLFVTDPKSGATGVMNSFSKAVDDLVGTPASLVKARQAALTTQSQAISNSIDDKNRRLDAYQANLKAQYAGLDSIMSKYQSLATAIDSIGKNLSSDK
jgi:flagellar hook-associated protein 2